MTSEACVVHHLPEDQHGGLDSGQPHPGVDPARWELLWSHRPTLLAVARRRVGWHDAEDVVDEAILRGIRATDVSPERMRAWLTTTTVHICADVHRRQASRARQSALMGARPEALAEPSHEDAVLDRAEARSLVSRLERLPGRQAEALWLRARGMSVQAVAEHMGLPPKAVESLLGRARRSLRRGAAAALVLAVGVKVIATRKTQLHLALAAAGGALTLCSVVVHGVVVPATGTVGHQIVAVTGAGTSRVVELPAPLDLPAPADLPASPDVPVPLALPQR